MGVDGFDGEDSDMVEEAVDEAAAARSFAS